MVLAAIVVLALGLRTWTAFAAARNLSRALAQAEAHWGPPGEAPAAPPAAAPGENAAVLLRAAVAAHGLPASPLAVISRFKRSHDGAPADRAKLQATVTDHAEALSLLDDALDLPVVDWRAEPC